MRWSSAFFSAGLFLVPVTTPVQDAVQPLIPPPVAAPQRSVPGYACDHPRKGYQYARMKGVGDLPRDLIDGGWICSDGCGVEFDCAVKVKQSRIPIGDMDYIYRKR